MRNFLRNPDVMLGASAALVVIVSALVGQYAARGMSLRQWSFGLLAIAASITLAVILRCWPAPEKTEVRAED
jgi:hypothetical protein